METAGLACAGALLFLSAAPRSIGQDLSAQWLNGTGNWSDPTQWSTNPSFPNNGTQAYAVTAGAGTLTLDQNITVDQFTLSYNPPQTNPPTNVTLAGNDTLTVNSSFSWNTGTLSGNGTINSLGASTISGTGNSLAGWSLNLDGTTSLSGQITASSGGAVTNALGATLNMADGSSIGATGGNNGSLANNGVLNVSAPSQGSNIAFNNMTNSGTVNINSGALNLSSAVTSSGAINVASGATLNMSSQAGSSTFTSASTITGGGTANFEFGTIGINGTYGITGATKFTGANVTFGSATSFASSNVSFQQGTVTFSGPVNINQATTAFSGASVYFNGPIQNLGTSAAVSAGTVSFGSSVSFSTFQLSSGTVSGSGAVTAAQSFQWSGGTMLGTGTINAQGTSTFSGTGATLAGWSINLGGTTSFTGQVNAPSGTITNASGANLNMADGSSFSGSYGTYATMANNGILNVAAPSQASTIGVANLTNSGTINVNSGTLNLGSAINGSGAINVASGATLNINSTQQGLSTFSSGSTITGAGAANFKYGGVTVNGTYGITGATSFTGAYVTFGGSTTFASSNVHFQSGEVTFGGPVNITQATTDFGQTAVTFNGPIQSVGTSAVVNTGGLPVTFNSSVSLSALQLKSGEIAGSGNVTVANSFQWNGGLLGGTGTITALGGVAISTSTSVTLNQALNIYGSSSATSSGPSYYSSLSLDSNAAVMTIEPGATFNGSSLQIFGSDEAGLTWGTLANNGLLIVYNPTSSQEMFVSGINVVNNGTIRVTNGTFYALNTGGGSGAPFNQNSGSLVLSNGTLAGSQFNINGGSLTGNGTANSLYSNGLIAPTGGNLQIRNLTLGSASTLSFQLGGIQAGTDYDQITTSSTTLNGNLEIAFSEDFQSSITSLETFIVLTSTSALTGQFENVSNGGRLETTDGDGSFQVNYSGDDVLLSNFMPTPEPGSTSILLCGVGALAGRRYRRRGA